MLESKQNMKKRPRTVICSLIGIAVLLMASASSWAASDDVIPVEKYQPPIVELYPPGSSHGWKMERPLVNNGLNLFAANVPSYDGKGMLFSSWTAQNGRVFERPTIIIVHGGHGVAPGNLDTAVWAKRNLDANILILDSYWSRGRTENWLSWTRFGANMRVLDLIAAARFTQSEGADPKKTFVIGDSQGGWTVLRAFTNHNLSSEVRSLLAGGVSLYPNCYVKESIFGRAPSGSTDKEDAPPLGNYVAPVIAFTGTADTATPLSQCNVDKVFKGVEKWTNFEGATHAWDSPTRGVGRRAEDNVCTRALNKYNPFPICSSNKFTDITRSDIQAFVERHLPKAQ